jgi:hypothetical protein
MRFKSHAQRKAVMAKYYSIKYSDGTKFITSYKPKLGKAKGEAGQMGLKIVSIKKISKPTLWQRFKSFD